MSIMQYYEMLHATKHNKILFAVAFVCVLILVIIAETVYSQWNKNRCNHPLTVFPFL